MVLMYISLSCDQKDSASFYHIFELFFYDFILSEVLLKTKKQKTKNQITKTCALEQSCTTTP